MLQKSYSFQKGYNLVKNKDVAKVKKRIMNALNITSRPGWIARLRGDIEPRISEAAAIEAIFKEFGVTEIWGEDESQCSTD